MRAGWPHGFFVLDGRAPGRCDLAYFGLVPEAIGRGLGTFLLQTAVHMAWDRPGTRAGDGQHQHARPPARAAALPEGRLRAGAARDAAPGAQPRPRHDRRLTGETPMFETLKPTPPDKIIELMGLFTRRPAHRQARPRRRRLQGRRRPHPGDARGQGRRGAAARRAGHQVLRRHPRRPRTSSTRWATSPSATRCRASGSPAPRPRAAPARSASSSS